MRKIIVFILMEYPVQSKTQTKKTALGLQVINSIILLFLVISTAYSTLLESYLYCVFFRIDRQE